MKQIEVNTVSRMHTISGKGSFPFEQYQRLRGGENRLYLERPMIDHPSYDYLSLYLLPDLGIQICKYRRYKGSDWFDWYIDIVEAHHYEGIWRVTDLFADVVVKEGEAYRVVDLDELSEGYRSGLVTTAQLIWALESLQRVCNSLHINNCCVMELIK